MAALEVLLPLIMEQVVVVVRLLLGVAVHQQLAEMAAQEQHPLSLAHQ